MRGYGFLADGTGGQVLLVEVVDAWCGFTEEFAGSVTKQLVGGRGDESDNTRGVLEELQLGWSDPIAR